jgi:LPXTG-motif cell wall-anchored protein
MASGSVLVTATAAGAATTHVPASSIAPTASSYLGWHAELGTFADAWNGLRVGAGSDSYVLNGLVATGAPGLSTTGAALGTLITGSSITGSGSVQMEVPVSVGTVNPPASGSWSTLYSRSSVVGTSPQLTDLWISTRAITLNGANVPANTAMPLADILTQLDVAGDVKYSGFGFYAANQSPAAAVSSMTFGADTYTFGRIVSPVASSSKVTVAASDIRPDETSYPGWHEGYTNATPAFSVQDNGLHLGVGANSQIINGLASPLATTDPFSLLTSASVSVVSGEAFLQVPVFFGPGTDFSTLRPAVGATAGTTGVALTDQWISSRAIPASATTPAIAANSPVVLGDLLEALLAQGGSLRVLAFGVLAQSTAPAVVSALVWNGVTYSFVPELAATGAQDATPLAIGGGLLLLLGGALLMMRRRLGRDQVR